MATPTISPARNTTAGGSGGTPPLTAHWFLPTYGDSRGLVGGGHGVPASAAGTPREASLGYLAQIARAAETVGFEGALTPTGAWCEDAWLTTAMLAAESERLKFLVAFRPGGVSPTLAAQMGATFQRHSGGRLLVNVVTGGEPSEQRAYGDFLDKDARYTRTGEFLDVVRRLWAGEQVSLDGEQVHVEGAQLQRLPDPVPPIYFGGSSPAAGDVAAKHVDVYLTWGEPPAQVAEKIDWIRGLAAAQGREVRFGIRLHVITRDTADAAWAQAEELLRGIPAEMIEQVQAGLSRSESVGQQRMRSLHSGGRRAPPTWRCPPTCGRASGSSAAAPGRPSSGATPRSPTGSRSTTRWASPSSCSPATPTSRRPTGSARARWPSSAGAGCGVPPRGRRPRARRTPRPRRCPSRGAAR